jgi:tRNA(Ile)-lysidine synthase
VADVLARSVESDPAGFLWLDPGPLMAAPVELSQRALARCLMAIGGEAYPPRLERLRRLHDRIAAGGLGGGATLAGCRIVVSRGRLLICRELAAVEPALPVRAGQPAVWDGRFSVRLGQRSGRGGRLQVAALGSPGYRALLAQRPDLKNHPIPALARLSLPALWEPDKAAQAPLAVPHLDNPAGNPQVSVDIEFVPAQALTPTRFTVA